MAERLKATVLKTVIPKGIGGSNPSCSVGYHLVTFNLFECLIPLLINIHCCFISSVYFSFLSALQNADNRLLSKGIKFDGIFGERWSGVEA